MFYKLLCFSFSHKITKAGVKRNKPAAQAAEQTLPYAAPPVGIIHPFSKIAVTFEPILQFRCSSSSEWEKNWELKCALISHNMLSKTNTFNSYMKKSLNTFFSKHWPSGPMISIGRNVRLCVCVSVCVSVCPSVHF